MTGGAEAADPQAQNLTGTQIRALSFDNWFGLMQRAYSTALPLVQTLAVIHARLSRILHQLIEEVDDDTAAAADEKDPSAMGDASVVKNLPLSAGMSASDTNTDGPGDSSGTAVGAAIATSPLSAEAVAAPTLSDAVADVDSNMEDLDTFASELDFGADVRLQPGEALAMLDRQSSLLLPVSTLGATTTSSTSSSSSSNKTSGGSSSNIPVGSSSSGGSVAAATGASATASGSTADSATVAADQAAAAAAAAQPGVFTSSKCSRLLRISASVVSEAVEHAHQFCQKVLTARAREGVDEKIHSETFVKFFTTTYDFIVATEQLSGRPCADLRLCLLSQVFLLLSLFSFF